MNFHKDIQQRQIYTKFKREYQKILIQVYVTYSGKIVAVDFNLQPLDSGQE